MTPDNLAEIKAATISDEQLRDMLASIPRHADGSVRATWVARIPAPIAYALVTELQQHRADPSRKGEVVADLVRRLGVAADGVEKASFEQRSMRRGYEGLLREAAAALASPTPAATVPPALYDLMSELGTWNTFRPGGSQEFQEGVAWMKAEMRARVASIVAPSPTNTTESDGVGNSNDGREDSQP